MFFFFPVTDVSQYTGESAGVREQTPQLNTRVHQERSEPLPKKPKEEQIECDISWGEQQQALWGDDNFITPDCVKTDPEEEENINMPCIANSFHIQGVYHNPDSSATHSADEVNYGHEDISSVDSDEVTGRLTLYWREEITSKCREPQKDKSSNIKVNLTKALFACVCDCYFNYKLMKWQ